MRVGIFKFFQISKIIAIFLSISQGEALAEGWEWHKSLNITFQDTKMNEHESENITLRWILPDGARKGAIDWGNFDIDALHDELKKAEKTALEKAVDSDYNALNLLLAGFTFIVEVHPEDGSPAYLCAYHTCVPDAVDFEKCGIFSNHRTLTKESVNKNYTIKETNIAYSAVFNTLGNDPLKNLLTSELSSHQIEELKKKSLESLSRDHRHSETTFYLNLLNNVGGGEQNLSSTLKNALAHIRHYNPGDITLLGVILHMHSTHDTCINCQKMHTSFVNINQNDQLKNFNILPILRNCEGISVAKNFWFMLLVSSRKSVMATDVNRQEINTRQMGEHQYLNQRINLSTCKAPWVAKALEGGFLPGDDLPSAAASSSSSATTSSATTSSSTTLAGAASTEVAKDAAGVTKPKPRNEREKRERSPTSSEEAESKDTAASSSASPTQGSDVGPKTKSRKKEKPND